MPVKWMGLELIFERGQAKGIMELKVNCDCGQNYKFDVEPINGQMPSVINCPACGTDGTAAANSLLTLIPPAPTAVTAPAGLRISHAVAESPSIPSIAPPLPRPIPTGRPTAHAPASATPKYLQTNQAIQNNSFILGIVGAVLGAVVGIVLMVGFTMLTGFRFPFVGIAAGAIIGFGARLMYRGTDSTLGLMAAVVALVTILGTFLLMFNIFSIMYTGVISLMIGVRLAWRIASG